MIHEIAPWRVLESPVAGMGRGGSMRRVSTERARDKRGAASGPQAVVSLRGFAPHIQAACRRTSSKILILLYSLCGSMFCERVRP